MKNLISIKDLSKEKILFLLDKAESFIVNDEIIQNQNLKGKKIATLFFENSTRTKISFDLAIQNLGATNTNLNISSSSISKGESFLDTLYNLQAMEIDCFIMRHYCAGVVNLASESLFEMSFINAGDGKHSHPTQALLDMLTIKQFKGDFENLKIAIVGDILHSRVARSNIEALNILGCKDVRLIAPKTLLNDYFQKDNVKVYSNLEYGIKNVDVIIALRIQAERIESSLIPSLHEFYQNFAITNKVLKLACNDCIVLHPGPVNRMVEIESNVVDSSQSVILQQVRNGVAIRMAVLDSILRGKV